MPSEANRSTPLNGFTVSPFGARPIIVAIREPLEVKERRLPGEPLRLTTKTVPDAVIAIAPGASTAANTEVAPLAMIVFSITFAL